MTYLLFARVTAAQRVVDCAQIDSDIFLCDRPQELPSVILFKSDENIKHVFLFFV